MRHENQSFLELADVKAITAAGGRVSFLSAPDLKGLLEGGVPIVKDGNVLGAVRVSGVKSNEDVQIARAGIAAIGLA